MLEDLVQNLRRKGGRRIRIRWIESLGWLFTRSRMKKEEWRRLTHHRSHGVQVADRHVTIMNDRRRCNLLRAPTPQRPQRRKQPPLSFSLPSFRCSIKRRPRIVCSTELARFPDWRAQVNPKQPSRLFRLRFTLRRDTPTKIQRMHRIPCTQGLAECIIDPRCHPDSLLTYCLTCRAWVESSHYRLFYKQSSMMNESREKKAKPQVSPETPTRRHRKRTVPVVKDTARSS